MTTPSETCVCHTPPIHYSNFERTFLGTDETLGRFAEVNFETCIHCGSVWLSYFVEYESRTASGRSYRGIIKEQDRATMTPESAVAYLEQLDWYIYGGSYFSSTGKVGKGKLHVDG